MVTHDKWLVPEGFNLSPEQRARMERIGAPSAPLLVKTVDNLLNQLVLVHHHPRYDLEPDSLMECQL